MGLRSLVALPLDKGGSVIRFTLESTDKADSDTLITSAAYGLSADQTLLFELPYRIDSGDHHYCHEADRHVAQSGRPGKQSGQHAKGVKRQKAKSDYTPVLDHR